ncbi:MAG: GNAT family N-acetyltransferase [Halorubrum sp.]
MNGAFTIEQASDGDRLDVLRVLDAAMLETDAERVADRIDAGDVFVARFERTGGVVGALVASRKEDGEQSEETLHVDAVAVRRARRGRGIGSALVEAAIDRGRADPGTDRVTVVFDGSLAGFYADLGFEVEPDRVTEGDEPPANDRLRGVLLVGTGVEAER